MANLETEILARITNVIGVASSEQPIGLHEPEIGEAEQTLLRACLDSTFVSSVGAYIPEFENAIAAFTGARHAIAVANGTVALQVSLHLAGVRHGDEVLVPTLSFVATANAVSHTGATPHFIDSEPETLGMDPEALASRLATFTRDEAGQLINPLTSARIAAISPMHTLGHPAKIEEICRIAAEYQIPVVEDAAESLGSFVTTVTGERKHTGTFGQISAISFNGNKIITTGGGGMIITDDPELARRAKHLTTTAKLPHKWEFEHDEVAWNFRLPNLNAALGVAQVGRLATHLEKKRRLAAAYRQAFAGLEGVHFVNEPVGSESNYWLCAIRLAEPDRELRDRILQTCHDANILVRPMWNLLHTQRMYQGAPAAGDPLGGSLQNAQALVDSLICLPSTPRLALGLSA